MNDAKAFFDTTVLLHMYGGDASKQSRAKRLFRQYAYTGRMLLSTQVVEEFYAAGSRELAMPQRELQDATAALLDCPLIVVSLFHIKAALQNEERYKIPFWDALILAAAKSGGAAILYSEALQDGQKYGTVLVRNPFRSRQVEAKPQGSSSSPL